MPSKLIFLRLTFLILVLATLLLLCCCCSPQDRSGDELFKAFVLDPIPSSVSVLHSHDQVPLFDPSIWLHFTVDPQDFDTILAAEAWTIDDFDFDGVYNTPVEDWWHPESLGEYTKYHVQPEDCDCWKTMWVNAERDQVYFRVDFQ
jgi:hypothetical protein